MLEFQELYFEDEPVIVFDDTWTMANIAVECDLAKSLSQARKQGWAEKIPHGFSSREKKKPFWILNK